MIIKEIKPESIKEQKMHCLELGSNERAQACWDLINQEKDNKSSTEVKPSSTVDYGTPGLNALLGGTRM